MNMKLVFEKRLLGGREQDGSRELKHRTGSARKTETLAKHVASTCHRRQHWFKMCPDSSFHWSSSSGVFLWCHVSLIRGWILSALLHRQARSALPAVCAAFADVQRFGMALARSRCYSHTAQEGLSLSTGDGVAFIWCHRHCCQSENDTRTDPQTNMSVS